MSKSTHTAIEKDTRLDELSDEILRLGQEYWEEFSRRYPAKAVVWIRNDETRQFFAYSRGENSQDIINLIDRL